MVEGGVPRSSVAKSQLVQWEARPARNTLAERMWHDISENVCKLTVAEFRVWRAILLLEQDSHPTRVGPVFRVPLPGLQRTPESASMLLIWHLGRAGTRPAYLEYCLNADAPARGCHALR